MESKYQVIYQFLNPIKHLIGESSITEIMINKPNDVWVKRYGCKSEKVKTEISSDQIRGLMTLLASVSNKIISDEKSIEKNYQIISAAIPGFRFEAWNTPVSLHGPSMTIRRINKDSISLENYKDFGTINHETYLILKKYVTDKRNIIIAGSTGSGKTTFCSSLLNCIDSFERLIVIENIQELNLLTPNVLYLQTDEEQGYSVNRLLASALRGLPDRIIIGELRGIEAEGYLKVANTGHPGSMTTLHANSAFDALQRLEDMIQSNDSMSQSKSLKNRINAIKPVVIYLSSVIKKSTFLPIVTEIIEISGVENGIYSINKIFKYK
jgi:pilus assembly protein CpaF